MTKRDDLLLVLCYTSNEEKRAQLEHFCRSFGCRLQPIRPSDIDRSVGSLAGIKQTMQRSAQNVRQSTQEIKKAPPLYQQAELLIFSGFSSEKLDAFLQGYRQAGIAPIPLKAVLTPYNCSWSVYELTQELMQEHIAMMERRKTNESDCSGR